ncbi:hypothetical protein NCC49_002872 [Naganishia albida]|nr:hypothetical protein NCC49_002872 [Naganishia albida]
MYLRPVHTEHDISTLRELIKQVQLGVLITAIPSTTASLIQSSHIPWTLHLDDESSETEYGVLRGHMAKPNPQARLLADNAHEGGGWEVGQEVMVLFTGVDHYISPQHYVDTKPKTGKVVPTWNYASVAVYGKAKIYHSANSETSAFLQSQMESLTSQSESREKYLPSRWEVADAPERYVNLLKKAVIGIEIRIDRLEGKFKMSQELDEGDRRGVVEGLAKADEKGQMVAKMVEDRGKRQES